MAATRAKRLLVGTGHTWRVDLSNAADQLRTTSERSSPKRGSSDQLLAEAGPPGAQNPLVVEAAPRPWPQPLDPDALAAGSEAALAVETGATPFRRDRDATTTRTPCRCCSTVEESVAGWDADLDRLLAEAAARVRGSPGQTAGPAVDHGRAAAPRDPEGYAAELARPMPRQPSRAARFGTRFHQWVERYFDARLPSGALGQQQLVDPDESEPTAPTSGSHDELELRELCEAFAAGRFGSSVPYAIEAPFTLRGRGPADPRPDRRRLRAARTPDPGPSLPGRRLEDRAPARAPTRWQLAIYRLAWAEAQQIPAEQVDAAFYYVRSDRARPARAAARSGRARAVAERRGSRVDKGIRLTG